MNTRNSLKEIIELVEEKWRPFDGSINKEVYEKLKCSFFSLPEETAPSPQWFNKGDIFLCIGCTKKCTLSRPNGFEMPRVINYPISKTSYNLSPQEMLTRLRVLTVGQAAYCLNVSRAQVYYWLGMSQLRKLKEKPIRIPTEDIREMLDNIEE